MLTVFWVVTNSLSCAVGAYKGYTLPRIVAQAKPSSITRPIPPQPTFLKLPLMMILFGGI